jgi:hypothetical protein
MNALFRTVSDPCSNLGGTIHTSIPEEGNMNAYTAQQLTAF